MKKSQSDPSHASDSPRLVNRRANRDSTFQMGRTIAEKREKLETRSERELARKKDKNRQTRRVIFTVVGFLLLIVILVAIALNFVRHQDDINKQPATTTSSEPRVSNLQIVDEAATSGHEITSRMRVYIGQLEGDLIDLGYSPQKVVIPAGSIREVDIYLDGHPGYFKTHIDRGSAVTAEDIDRMIRYLAGQGITTYEYVDVRISGKAYWK